jgi:hypothetical protein
MGSHFYQKEWEMKRIWIVDVIGAVVKQKFTFFTAYAIDSGHAFAVFYCVQRLTQT